MASSPQFSSSPIFAYNTTNITAANTAADGTGTVTFLQTNVGGTTADLVIDTGGAYIDSIEIIPRGTNVLTVVRVFANANATNATAANNQLIKEATAVATTVSQTAALPPIIINVKRWFPAGTKFFVTLGTAVAAGFNVSLYGGQV